MHVTETNKSLMALSTAREIADSSDKMYFETEVNQTMKYICRQDIEKEVGKLFRHVTDENDKEALTYAFENTPIVTHTSKPADPSIQLFYKPTVKGLAYVSLEYKEKYGIDIWVVSRLVRMKKLLERASKENLKSFGAIICHHFKEKQEKDLGHVTPLLFIYNKRSRRWDIFANDSIGNKNREIDDYITISSLLSHLPVESTCINEKERQIDAHSCRVDALVSLRNLLLEIKDRSRASLYDLLPLSGFDSEGWGRIKYTKVLLADAYSCQYPVEEQLLEKEVVREKFSKDKSKREKPKTVSDLRKMHTFDVVKETRYQFSSNPGEDHLEEFLLERTSKCNLYLLYKSAQLFSKVMNAPEKYSKEELDSVIFYP